MSGSYLSSNGGSKIRLATATETSKETHHIGTPAGIHTRLAFRHTTRKATCLHAHGKLSTNRCTAGCAAHGGLLLCLHCGFLGFLLLFGGLEGFQNGFMHGGTLLAIPADACYSCEDFHWVLALLRKNPHRLNIGEDAL